MLTPTCSRCKRAIPAEEINVGNDVAYCRSCNLSYKLSELTQGNALEEVDVNRPPAGAWYRSDMAAVVIGASHRSIGSALGLLFMALFWNGIVSVFVVVNLASTLRHLGIPLPHWFPAPNMKGSPMGVGMTIFLWIFLTPFIAIGLGMVAAFLSCLAGRTEVRIENREAIVFTGIGPLGRRRRFETTAATEVRLDDKRWRDSDGDSRRKTEIVIELREGKPVRLGTMLSEERRKFVAGALRRSLVR